MLSFYWQRIVNNIKTTYLLPVGAEHALEIPLFYIRFGFESWKYRRSHWPLYRQWIHGHLLQEEEFYILPSPYLVEGTVSETKIGVGENPQYLQENINLL